MTPAIRVENLGKKYRVEQGRPRAGYRTLREDGLVKARRGETSIEEVLRVTGLNS